MLHAMMLHQDADCWESMHLAWVCLLGGSQLYRVTDRADGAVAVRARQAGPPGRRRAWQWMHGFDRWRSQ